MAAELAGVDGVRVWHDQALIKRPYREPDRVPSRRALLVVHIATSDLIWIALDDATDANGCLYFFPGSHLETTWRT